MNILFIVADLGLGGAQQIVVNLTNSFAVRGHTVFLYDVFPDLRRKEIVNKLNSDVHLVSRHFTCEPKGFFQIFLNFIGKKFTKNARYFIDKKIKNHKKELMYLVSKVGVDVVNSHVIWADKFVLENRLFENRKWWITLHGSYCEAFRNNLISSLNSDIESITAVTDGFIYLSNDELDLIDGIVSKREVRFEYIANGTPINSQQLTRTYPTKVKKVLIASRAIVEKGWLEAGRVISKLVSEGEKIELFFAGDGPDLEYFKDEFQNHEFIKFLGFVVDISDLIRTVDIVLLPSHFEIYPTILLESIVIGTPIITTDVGSSKLIVGSNGNCRGTLITSEVSKIEDDLYLALRNYISTPQLLTAHAMNCWRSRHEFGMNSMTEHYEKLFLEKDI